MRKGSIYLIKLYQLVVSPIFSAMGYKCRFYPSCSEYSLGVFKKYNFWRASWLTVARIAKCNPLHPGGFDPI